MKNNIKNKVWNLVKLSVFTFPLSVFVSCSQEEDFSQSDATDVVKVVASVSNMQTRVTYGDNGATNFTNGDAIKVVNTLRTSKHEATYTTTDGTNWTTSDAFVWNGGAGKNNQFNAWYPIADYSSYDGFTIPTDQSDVTKLASADWMTASTEAMAKPADQVLNLNFQHRLTKVTVKIANWGTEYEGWEPITDVNIYSKTSQYPDVTDDLVAVTPLQNGETEFTAIVAPMAYKSTDQLMVFTVDYTDNLTVFANNSTLTSGLEPGKHYTFSLKVGKDAVGIENVVVTDWTEKEIDGGVAEEVLPASTEAELVAALENGGKIMLTDDITVSDEYPFGYYIAKNTAINLNGHTITGRGVFSLLEEENVVLTISGNGTIKNTDPNFTSAIDGFGTLNILGGTIEGGTNIFGPTIMSGGWVDDMHTDKHNSDEDTSSITGGYVRHLNCWGGILMISGGHVETLGIKYGTIIISGGTFGFDPTAYLAEGYTATEADGKWTVTPENN